MTAAPDKRSAPDELLLDVSELRIVNGRGQPVVADVSFTLRPGQVLGLVGESGSGKTAIAHALLGHARRGLRIAAGSVRLHGTDLLTLEPRRLRAVRGAAVAYVPQDPGSAFDATLRIGAQLAEALRIHGVTAKAERRARIAEALADVQLDPARVLRRYPHQMSGGQLQRVAIAMAFLLHPSVIVLDEPTTGLDVTTQRHVITLVARLAGEHGSAVVYVSHDLAVVSGLATRVAVLYAGQLMELGPTAAVFAAPVHPYSRALIAAIPQLGGAAGAATGIPGSPPRPGSRGAGCAFSPRCGFATAACTATVIPLAVVKAGTQHAARCLRATDSGWPGTAQGERSGLVTLRQSPNEPSLLSRDPILHIDGLRASHNGHPVLDDVTFTIDHGASAALVGSSGSGKTTLARCIVGLHTGWTGSISFSGTRLVPGVAGRTAETLRDIQYVFQNPYNSLNPRRTLGSSIEMPLRRFTSLDAGVRRARVRDLLAEVALDPAMADRYPGELSGGERQRAAIARALAAMPRLLVCDEVTSALDVSVQATIVRLLRALQRDRGLSLLFITHNLALVQEVAANVVVLDRGRIVEQGPADRVLVEPATDYTRRLLADAPVVERVDASRL
jgi:peptide/nickel transport system ATP-binding protein